MKYRRGIIPIIAILLIILAGSVVAGGGYALVKRSERANEHSSATSTNKLLELASSSAKVEAKVEVKAEVKNTPLQSQTYGNNLKIVGSVMGWPAKVNSTVDVNGSIESYPGMIVVKVVPKIQSASEYTVTISGLPANADLYVYTQGYRVEEIKHTNASGELTFKLTTPQQFIIKDKKS